MATTISTDKSRQLNWVIRQATDQSINLQFNNIGGGGFDLSSYVLRLDVLSHEGQTLLSLTQGSGITNGGPSGLVTISINKTKSNIVEGRHWYKLYNTSPSDYVIITGVFQVNAGVFDDSFSNNQSLLVSLGTTQVNVDVTLIGGGGGGVTAGDKGDITVTLVPENWTIDNNAVTNAKINDVAWSKITGTPTSLSAYGVTGAETLSSLRLNGTAGAGFLQWDWQSTNPAGTASRTTMWADATGRLNWRLGTGGSSFIRTFDATGITANRTYTLPDFSGTLFGQGANVLTAPASFSGNKVTFTPNATLAGLNVGSFGTSPSSLALGDIWFNDADGNYQGRVSTGTRLFTVSAGIADTRVPYGLGTINELTSSASFTYNGTTLLVGGTTPTASTTLDIRGPGTDNTTSAARFANSANIQLMRLFNGGSLLLGGTTLTDNNTIFEIQSTTQGFALPRMTTTQRNAITSPYSGLQIHSTTSNRPNWHNGTAWQEAASRSDLSGWLTGATTGNINVTGSDDFKLRLGDFATTHENTISLNQLAGVEITSMNPDILYAALSLFNGGITVQTDNNEGIKYLVDYSSTFVDRSLIDRGYVLSRLNGWLTGSTTGNITVAGNNDFSLDFGDFGVTHANGFQMTAAGINISNFDPSLNTAQISLLNGAVNIEGTTGMSLASGGTITSTEIRYTAPGFVTNDRSLTDRGYVLGAKTFTGRQTFATGDNGSLVVGTHTADDSSPVDGLIMYNTTSNTFRFRQNGAWVGLGGGGGVTNLSYTASPTQGTVVSDTGNDATIPAGNTTNASLMLPGDKTKLDGIQSNATANSTDAQLRDRATHTGTQTASTISDFANTVRTTVLTGLSLITGGVISATDSILVGFGKLQNQITALGSSKQDALVSGTNIKTLEGQSLLGSGNIDLSKSDVGLANVDNTSDANKPISTATQTALNGKENTITAGTTSQYFRGDKTFQTLNKAAVGLSNVDNTSDLNKPISTATQTALDGKQKVITSGTAAPSGGVDGDIYLQFT